MITIGVMNQKGGVGKITLTRNPGECLATTFGKKVLLADLDPQAERRHESIFDGKNTAELSAEVEMPAREILDILYR